MKNKMNNKMNNKRVKKVLALTLGLGLAVGSLTMGTSTIAQANQKPAGIQNMQTGHKNPMPMPMPMYDKASQQEMLTLLQIDEQTFNQEIDSGNSLREIGATHNVPRQTIVNLLVKNMSQHIDTRLADNRITVEQADEMKSNIVDRAQKMVDGLPMGPTTEPMTRSDKMHRSQNNGHEKSMMYQQIPQDMLTLLKVDELTFKQEISSGKSLAEIAEAHNVSRQAVIDLIVKNMSQQIDKGVAEKRITAEQAIEMKTDALKKAQMIVDRSMNQQVEQTNKMKNHAVEKDQKMNDKTANKTEKMNDKRNSQNQNDSGISIEQELLALLKIDAQTFEQEQNSGKTLAEIAATHNVSREAVVDLIVKNMSQQIDKGVAEQRITEEKATELKANSDAKAQEIVDKNLMEQPAAPQK